MVKVALTPGPLVVALKPDNNPVGHNWPPTNTSIELVAASYIAAPPGVAAVRLFNLSPDTALAGMSAASKSICNGVKYVPSPTDQGI